MWKVICCVCSIEEESTSRKVGKLIHDLVTKDIPIENSISVGNANVMVEKKSSLLQFYLKLILK